MQRGEETRNHILEVCARLFAESGYEATGVAEICASAGISKGAFYHHFTSKQAVFLQLLQNWLAGLDRELQATLENVEDIPEALIQMAAQTRSVFQAADGRLSMFLEFWTQSSRDPLVWKETIAPYRRYQELFAAIIQRGIDQGLLRPIDAQLGARAIVGLAVGMLLQGLLDPQGTAWDQATVEAVLLLLEGMQRREP